MLRPVEGGHQGTLVVSSSHRAYSSDERKQAENDRRFWSKCVKLTVALLVLAGIGGVSFAIFKANRHYRSNSNDTDLKRFAFLSSNLVFMFLLPLLIKLCQAKGEAANRRMITARPHAD